MENGVTIYQQGNEYQDADASTGMLPPGRQFVPKPLPKKQLMATCQENAARHGNRKMSEVLGNLPTLTS